jgi:hypothetical protein
MATELLSGLPPYVTVRQLAEALQCCPQTIRNMCRRGVLPAPLSLSRRKQLWDVEAVRAALVRLQQGGVQERDAG